MRNLKTLLSVALIGFGFYVAWLLVPVYFSSYQFQDLMDSEAKLSAYSTKPEAEIEESLMKKAKDLDLPIEPNHIHVIRNGNEVSITADYTVHVDIPFHPVDLTFTPSTKNKRI